MPEVKVERRHAIKGEHWIVLYTKDGSVERPIYQVVGAPYLTEEAAKIAAEKLRGEI